MMIPLSWSKGVQGRPLTKPKGKEELLAFCNGSVYNGIQAIPLIVK